MSDAHSYYEDLILGYAADSLSADERAAIEAHLAACEPCRALLTEWRELADAVRTQANREAVTLPPLRLPVLPVLPALPVEMTKPSHNHQEHDAMFMPTNTAVYPNGHHNVGAHPRIRPLRGHTQMSPYSLTALAAWIAVLLFAATLIFGGDNAPALVATQTDEPLGTVYEVLAADGRFDLTVELIEQDEWLLEILNGDDPVTLFAMRDYTLQPMLNMLAEYEPEMTADIVKRLVWSGLRDAWSVEMMTAVARRNMAVSSREKMTLRSEWRRGIDRMVISFAVALDEDGELVIVDPGVPTVRAHILQGDIPASNGLIHVIDTPLVTHNLPILSDHYLDQTTLAAILRTEPEFSGFYGAFELSAWAQDVLKGPSFITLLIPTNEAVERWLDGRRFADFPREEIDQFILAHLLRGQWSADLLASAGSVRGTWEINGQTYSRQVTAALTEPTDGVVRLNDRANVTRTNNIASNGVYHVIDEVLYEE